MLVLFVASTVVDTPPSSDGCSAAHPGAEVAIRVIDSSPAIPTVAGLKAWLTAWVRTRHPRRSQ